MRFKAIKTLEGNFVNETLCHGRNFCINKKAKNNNGEYLCQLCIHNMHYPHYFPIIRTENYFVEEVIK